MARRKQSGARDGTRSRQGGDPQRALRSPAPEIELVGTLRWLREHSVAPGPWNAADARQAWAVGCPRELASLVHYHARRPTVTFEVGTLTDPAAWARAAGVRYLLLAEQATESMDGFEPVRRAGALSLWRSSAGPLPARASPAD